MFSTVVQRRLCNVFTNVGGWYCFLGYRRWHWVEARGGNSRQGQRRPHVGLLESTSRHQRSLHLAGSHGMQIVSLRGLPPVAHR
jgi:hypothetical protein